MSQARATENGPWFLNAMQE